MKRSSFLLGLLAACSQGHPAPEDGIGAGQQIGCVAADCQSEATRYETCLHTTCDAQYRGCYGPDYASKVYSGAPCSSYQACIDACNCDTVCQTRCGDAPGGCLICLSGALNTCLALAECSLPQCPLGDAGVNVGACNRLSACCSSLTNEASKVQCTTLYNNLSPSGDDICAGILPTFCLSN